VASNINRRSFMARIVGGAAISGSALSLVTGQAGAQTYTGRSDSDPTDRANYGHNQTGYSDHDSTDLANQGRPPTGYSDSDSGPQADPANQGRGRDRPPPSGVSDRDSNDAAGEGRNQTGRSDSDSTDLANQGRGTGCSDSDSGEGRDRVGYGRCPDGQKL